MFKIQNLRTSLEQRLLREGGVGVNTRMLEAKWHGWWGRYREPRRGRTMWFKEESPANEFWRWRGGYGRRNKSIGLALWEYFIDRINLSPWSAVRGIARWSLCLSLLLFIPSHYWWSMSIQLAAPAPSRFLTPLYIYYPCSRKEVLSTPIRSVMHYRRLETPAFRCYDMSNIQPESGGKMGWQGEHRTRNIPLNGLINVQRVGTDGAKFALVGKTSQICPRAPGSPI